VAACVAAAWGLALAGSLVRGDWNNRVNDLFFMLRLGLRGPEKSVPSIGYVQLADSDVQDLGMKGGDRSPYARLVNVLRDAGAASVTFDIQFPEHGEPAGDAAFTKAARDAGFVYLPVVLGLRPRAAAADAGALDPAAPWLWHPTVSRPGNPFTASAVTLSYPELAAAAKGIASINSDPDPDGIYRRMPLLFRCGEGWVPSLALRVAADAMGVDPSSITVAFGRSIRLPGARMRDGTTRTVDIPIDSRGRMILDYVGPWGRDFSHYSFARLLQAETDQDVADEMASDLDGAQLIVADITTSTQDYGPSPFEQEYLRSGLHANALNGILLDRFLRAPAWWVSLLLNTGFAALLWLAARRLRPLSFSLAALGCWAALVGAELWLFLGAGVMPALAAPTLGFAIALVAVNAYRFLLEERERLLTRARMERYFAPGLMNKILKTPGKLMSAEQKVITVLFSDIAGFTSWSTTQTPGLIHATLNQYFDVMTEIVFRNEGTVDKFIGDGLMAFFGDPLEQEDHALRAVRTGIEMQQAIRGLRAAWESEGRAPLHIRIGINTGEVVVGDMGSHRIMAYTAIGSTINLGSRLEGKAPVDGILVSAPVHDRVRDAVQTRFAGTITAKGITQEFDTYEVIVPLLDSAKPVE
jgi:adenylate cyclase